MKFQWYDPETEEGAGLATNREIDADRVEFAPGHVVFRDFEHRIILALRNGRVDDLIQLPEEKPDALKVCSARYFPGPGRAAMECTWSPGHAAGGHSWSGLQRRDESSRLGRKLRPDVP